MLFGCIGTALFLGVIVKALDKYVLILCLVSLVDVLLSLGACLEVPSCLFLLAVGMLVAANDG